MHFVALVGVTLILVRGTIFAPLQSLYPPLTKCAQCTGFWVGAVAGMAQIVSLGHGRPIDAILIGAANSFLALAAEGLLLKLLGDPEEK
jgi:hypothetical protein